MAPPAFVVVGNPKNRRVQFFQQALARCGLPPAAVIAYIDLLAGKIRLADVVTSRSIVRFESPGENWPVEQGLLQTGAAEAEAEGSLFLPAHCVPALEFDRGLILYPRQWYLGFRHLLRDWHSELNSLGDVQTMNSPADIEVMFDKPRCHALCRQAEITVPAALPRVGSFEELLAAMQSAGMPRVFVKLAHGSSASGVIALRRHGPHAEAVTSAELVREASGLRLYNSLRVRRYTEPDDVRELIDAVCRHGAHVEQWLPKASLKHGTTFDLRVVVIGGEPAQMVVRQSRSPLTNLHLGNRRGDITRLFDRMGAGERDRLYATCRRTANLFAGSLSMGLDVLLTPGCRSHALLEVNAFGDLLPGVMHQGHDTYETELRSLMNSSRLS